MSHPTRGRAAAAGAATLLLALFPRPVAAQFGPVEAFLRNVTDVSLYGSTGRLLPQPYQLIDEALYGYGVELLFQIGEVDRPIPGAEAPPRGDTARLVWKGVEIRSGGGRVDTVYTYEVEPVPPPGPPTRTIWTFEMGLGYGQVVGLGLRDPALEMHGSVRELPAASIYATYDPTGTYGGLRSGYMKTQGLELVDEQGQVIPGSADAFLVGAALGQSLEVGAVAVFLETAYTIRYFPSVVWKTDTLPDAAPRELRLNQLSFSAGIQVPLKPD